VFNALQVISETIFPGNLLTGAKHRHDPAFSTITWPILTKL